MEKHINCNWTRAISWELEKSAILDKEKAIGQLDFMVENMVRLHCYFLITTCCYSRMVINNGQFCLAFQGRYCHILKTILIYLKFSKCVTTASYKSCLSFLVALSLIHLSIPHSLGNEYVLEVVKNLPATTGDLRDVGSIPGSGRFPWRRKWQPTPVFLPGESYGQRSLAGHSPWGRPEPDMAEATEHLQ